MNNTITIILVVIALIALSSLARAGLRTDCNLNALVQDITFGGDLTETESSDILFLLEQERMARELFGKPLDMWGLGVFSMIESPEAEHLEAMRMLAIRYNILPADVATSGEYSNAELQTLYNSLYEQGSTSLSGALQAALTVEEMEIFELTTAIGNTEKEDLLIVYQNLLKDSRNFLRALHGHVQIFDETYLSQYLDAVTYDSILSTEMEPDCYNASGEAIALEDLPSQTPGASAGFGYGPGPEFWKGKEDIVSSN